MVPGEKVIPIRGSLAIFRKALRADGWVGAHLQRGRASRGQA